MLDFISILAITSISMILSWVLPNENYFRYLLLLAVCLLMFISICIYYMVKRYIDDSYTSYKSGVDYGLSNTEKSNARRCAKSLIKNIICISALLLLLHWCTNTLTPILISILYNFLAIYKNEDYASALQMRPPRKPKDIPRYKIFSLFHLIFAFKSVTYYIT